MTNFIVENERINQELLAMQSTFFDIHASNLPKVGAHLRRDRYFSVAFKYIDGLLGLYRNFWWAILAREALETPPQDNAINEYKREMCQSTFVSIFVHGVFLLDYMRGFHCFLDEVLSKTSEDIKQLCIIREQYREWAADFKEIRNFLVHSHENSDSRMYKRKNGISNTWTRYKGFTLETADNYLDTNTFIQSVIVNKRCLNNDGTFENSEGKSREVDIDTEISVMQIYISTCIPLWTALGSIIETEGFVFFS